MNEKQIIQKLQSKDKDEILDIPVLLINEKRWNIKIGFTYDDFYKVYRDYHLLPYHSEQLKKYFGDIIEI
ncbi:MAG: hypothetical protein U9N41_05305 [Euryarchaeota archaeon]|nr:hypothetical protein [Euryarchaeota archaeon]